MEVAQQTEVMSEEILHFHFPRRTADVTRFLHTLHPVQLILDKIRGAILSSNYPCCPRYQ
jgi:hypothetical protein